MKECPTRNKLTKSIPALRHFLFLSFLLDILNPLGVVPSLISRFFGNSFVSHNVSDCESRVFRCAEIPCQRGHERSKQRKQFDTENEDVAKLALWLGSFGRRHAGRVGDEIEIGGESDSGRSTLGG